MNKNPLEQKVVTLFTNQPEKFNEALEELFLKTHLIGPIDDNYEWCLVVTRKGQLKIYEQLSDVAELKSRTRVVNYEYEIVNQNYINILEKENYSREIIAKLCESKSIDSFIDWINHNSIIKDITIQSKEALFFRAAEELLSLLKIWNPLIHKETTSYLYDYHYKNYKDAWIKDYMNRIKQEVKGLLQEANVNGIQYV